ncbi:DUF1822 family protein [bacterium]|nr:DUF1822 family protein [bacterium]
MNELIPFPVPLSLEAHQQAQQACQKHFDLLKIKQVYLNTLAVCAVNFYVQCLGFETNLQDTYSSDPVARSLMDVADLQIKDYGTVECRPTSSNTSYCYVPRETWSDRIGYIAVHLNEALDEAALLGFTEQVNTEMLPTSALQSIDDFPIFLHQTRKPSEVVQLSQWLEQIFETSWQAVESVLESDTSELAFRSSTTQAIVRGKQLTLAQADEPVVLAIGLKPLTNQS